MERSSGWLRKNWQHTWRWNRHLHQHLQRNLKKLAKIVPVKLPQTPNLWAILLHGPVPTSSLSVLISNSKKHFHWFIYPSAVKANGCENTTGRSPIYQSCSCNSVRVGVNFLGSHIYPIPVMKPELLFLRLSVALLIGAGSLQPNCGVVQQWADDLTQDGFNKVNVLFVHMLPLNCQCHEGRNQWLLERTEYRKSV